MRKNEGRAIDGIILIAKPRGMTSHDVVRIARRSLGTRRIGHTGTLDPLATGLLILCMGKATRLARFLAAEDKIYRGRITLGVETDTYDSEGAVISTSPIRHLSNSAIGHAAAMLTGNIRQNPPPFSAKKISGVRSYDLARQGKPSALAPIDVHVDYFNILSAHDDTVEFEAKVSAGTYVRSLAHDLGRLLGCGAHISMLERLACGSFTLDHALALSVLKSSPVETLKEKMIPLPQISLSMPAVLISEEGSALLAHGRPVPHRCFIDPLDVPDGSRVSIYSSARGLLGIGTFSKTHSPDSPIPAIQPIVVLS